VSIVGSDERTLGALNSASHETVAQLPSRIGLHETLHTDDPDDRLLSRIADADREALSLLFRRHARMVRVLAERILRDRGEAEDLVQEVFLFVFRRAALFDSGKGSARSWLAQVTYHRAIDRRRQLISRHFYSSVEIEEGILQSEEPLGLTTHYDDTIEAALGRETLRRIDESLSEDQRRVIHLHFVDGYTVAEIAEIIGQSVGNVRNHYYRALERMRREVFATKISRK
jgi:RNA polymerase sigma-70 factor (ECF subfamily)